MLMHVSELYLEMYVLDNRIVYGFTTAVYNARMQSYLRSITTSNGKHFANIEPDRVHLL